MRRDAQAAPAAAQAPASPSRDTDNPAKKARVDQSAIDSFFRVAPPQAPPEPAAPVVAPQPAPAQPTDDKVAELFRSGSSSSMGRLMDWVRDAPEPAHRDAVPDAPPVMKNAVAAAMAALGELFASLAPRAAVPLLETEDLAVFSQLCEARGPLADQRLLHAAGRRPSPADASKIIFSPPCSLGEQCVGRQYRWAGLDPGETGPTVMAMMTHAELERHENGAQQQLESRRCLLCYWRMLLEIHTSTVLAGFPRERCAVLPRCAAVASDHSARDEDLYLRDMVVVPPADGSSPFGQAFPLLSVAAVRFVRRDPTSGLPRFTLGAYAANQQDFQ